MKKQLLICIILTLVLLSVSACTKKSYLSVDDSNTESDNDADTSSKGNSNNKNNSTKTSTDKCFVEIRGAVNCPGVYEVESSARVFHVIFMAGGLREDAYEDSLNQAGKITDGQKIVVLTKDEAAMSMMSEDNDGKVNINTADEGLLMTLPGIGESKAKAIIKYRENNGLFASSEDIKNISGIKDGVYSKIEDLIKV